MFLPCYIAYSLFHMLPRPSSTWRSDCRRQIEASFAITCPFWLSFGVSCNRPVTTTFLKMSSSSSIPKTTTPFTPKRPLSVQSNNNSLLASTHKRYKSTISVESKPRGVATPKPKGELTHLVTPLKNETAFRPKSRLAERPKTPSTPKLDEDNDKWMERDVSKVDVEGALVDASCIDVGDVSAEVDETSLRSISGNAEIQADDKVLVSVR